MTPSIDKLRCQCRIDGDDENGLLTLYAQAAKKRAENYVNRPLYDECVPEDIPDGLVISDDIKLAIMLAGGVLVRKQRGKIAPARFHRVTRTLSIYSLIGGEMKAGLLHHRITLRCVAIERSPLSEAEQHRAQEVVSVWCQVEAISNRKIRTSDQQRVVDTVLFTLRPRSDVEVDWQVVWQVVWQGRVLTVTAIDRSQRDRLVLRAEGDSRHDRV